MIQAEAIKSTHCMPELAIDNQLRDIRKGEIVKTRTITKHIASAIHLCGTQSIALRGHRDDSTADSGSNKENFLAILNYTTKIREYYTCFHFNEASKNAIYTRETIQNQRIEIIGDHRERKLTEMKEAKSQFYEMK